MKTEETRSVWDLIWLKSNLMSDVQRKTVNVAPGWDVYTVIALIASASTWHELSTKERRLPWICYAICLRGAACTIKQIWRQDDNHIDISERWKFTFRSVWVVRPFFRYCYLKAGLVGLFRLCITGKKDFVLSNHAAFRESEEWRDAKLWWIKLLIRIKDEQASTSLLVVRWAIRNNLVHRAQGC